MADLELNFDNCNVSIGKMFDIHDNHTVKIYSNTPKEKRTSSEQHKTQKTKNKQKPSEIKPFTLKYFRHDNKTVLTKQRKRVDIVFRKFIEWGWIDKDTSPDDFDSLFEGEKRYCNVTWTANATVLTILLERLIKQDYIQKQTGCSANSMVREQFGKTPNSDATRLKDADVKIDFVLKILDINTPLPQHNSHDDYELYDTTDAALAEIYSGQLRSTKGV